MLPSFKSIDFAFSVNVIHHDNRGEYFREGYSMLRPQGLLATVTDSEDTIRGRMPLAFYFPEIIEHELKRYSVIRMNRYRKE